MPGQIPYGNPDPQSVWGHGYDQEVVNNATYGSQDGGDGFGDQSLRISNAYTEPSGEFFYQTYSPSTADPAGETNTNHVFDGTFQFIPTKDSQQSDLFVSVSPDNGTGGRMSYVGLEDTANGIHINFYETAADGAFVQHSVGDYARTAVHTIRFLIETVPGPANDVLQLFVDNVDIGERDGACFTTWEQYYREGESHEPGVIDSFEFRTAGNGTKLSNLIGQGYLFDNVTTTTATSGGPATSCGAPPSATLNVTKFYDANADGVKNGTEQDISDWKVQVANGTTQIGHDSVHGIGSRSRQLHRQRVQPDPVELDRDDTHLGHADPRRRGRQERVLRQRLHGRRGRTDHRLLGEQERPGAHRSGRSPDAPEPQSA